MDLGNVMTMIGTGGLGALVATALVFAVGTADVGLRRRTETIKVFMDASVRAGGATAEGKPVGTGERIAAFYVLADLGSRDTWLYDAAKSQLKAEKSAADQRTREAAGRARISGYEYDEAVNVHGLDPEEDPWELWPDAQDLRRCETVSAAVGGALKRMERPRRRWQS